MAQAGRWERLLVCGVLLLIMLLIAYREDGLVVLPTDAWLSPQSHHDLEVVASSARLPRAC